MKTHFYCIFPITLHWVTRFLPGAKLLHKRGIPRWVRLSMLFRFGNVRMLQHEIMKKILTKAKFDFSRFLICQYAMIARKCAQRALLKLSRSSCGQGPEAPASEGRARARAKYKTRQIKGDQGGVSSTQNFEGQLLFRYWGKFSSFSFPVTCCFWKNHSCPCSWDMTTTCANLANFQFFPRTSRKTRRSSKSQ